MTGRRRDRRSGRPVRAVTVDLWYTLIYLRPVDRRALERKRRGVWTGAYAAAGLSRRRANALERARLAWCLSEERRGRAPTILHQATWAGRRAGVRLPAAPIARALDTTLLAAPVRVYPGARAALAQLRERGIRVGLVSNIVYESPRGARRLLARHELLRSFSAVALSTAIGASKPSPRPFRWCLRRLHVPPSAAVHVGDHPYDQLGAQRAGLRFVRFVGRPAAPLRVPARELERELPRAPRLSRWQGLGLTLRSLPP